MCIKGLTKAVGKVHPTLGELSYGFSDDFVFELIVRLLWGHRGWSGSIDDISKHFCRSLVVPCYGSAERRVWVVYRVRVGEVTGLTLPCGPIPEC